ncbi:DUF3298 and DUF4163 domain-containing protein [Alkalibacter mobilis]|uniref:DUF3298 and DUF4163 domain-containing protein n=1 Tax=Alkalibacter mobilis TaxID=2787712 RepID=UPI00189E2EB5|nr:DUF3298 and DUF4163 domain-containing protein [Alkalibacter mobilis]MBF7097009.1 DUF3298 and DUF4163 domain-containing protein [Alkalibacter mobilis]
MKILFKLITLVFLVVGTVSCSAFFEGEISSVSYSLKEGSKKILNDSGDVLLDFKVSYPIIDNDKNKNTIATINDYNEAKAEKYKAWVLSEGVDFADSDFEFCRTNDIPYLFHIYQSVTKITYNADGFLSILWVFDESTGGAHPTTKWSSEVFDLNSGKVMTLSDIMGLKEKEALSKIFSLVEEQIESMKYKADFWFFDDYEVRIAHEFNIKDFILTENSLRVYYQLYTLAPYSAGIQCFDIPLTETAVKR